MSKKHQKEKRGLLHSVYYRIYFCLIILFIGAMVFGLMYLWQYLGEYESARPIYAAQNAAKVFEKKDYNALYGLDTAVSALNFETQEDYVAYMGQLLDDKEITWDDAFSTAEGEKKYTVKADGKKFATFTMKQSAQKTGHGFEMWALDTVTTEVMVSKDYTITVPADSSVSVNGKALGQESVLESGIETASAGMLPSGLESPTLVKYGISLYLGEPTVSVTDRNGDTQTLEDDGTGAFACGLTYDQALQDAFGQNVMATAAKIANYTSEDLSKKGMLAYCYGESPAETYFNRFDNQWCPDHVGFSFENMAVSNFYQYVDGFFSCEVDFTYVIHYRKAADNRYDTHYTLYFCKYKDIWLLYNFSMAG